MTRRLIYAIICWPLPDVVKRKEREVEIGERKRKKGEGERKRERQREEEKDDEETDQLFLRQTETSRLEQDDCVKVLLEVSTHTKTKFL